MVRRRLGPAGRLRRASACRSRVAALSTLVALILGTLAAAALSRARFFGREAISLLLVLPIALPGIITGISLRAAFDLADIPFSFWTIVLGHATFCIVVVYNNAVARFRRLSPSLVEASMDLGADGFQTFRHVVLPNIAHGAPRRRHARLRAVLRRGDRHHLHRRPADDAADLDAVASWSARASGRSPTSSPSIVIALTFLPILAAYYLTRERRGGRRPGQDDA